MSLHPEARVHYDRMGLAREALVGELRKEFPVGAICEFEFHHGWIRGRVLWADFNYRGPDIYLENVKTGKTRHFSPVYKAYHVIERPKIGRKKA